MPPTKIRIREIPIHLDQAIAEAKPNQREPEVRNKAIERGLLCFMNLKIVINRIAVRIIIKKLSKCFHIGYFATAYLLRE